MSRLTWDQHGRPRLPPAGRPGRGAV